MFISKNSFPFELELLFRYSIIFEQLPTNTFRQNFSSVFLSDAPLCTGATTYKNFNYADSTPLALDKNLLIR